MNLKELKFKIKENEMDKVVGGGDGDNDDNQTNIDRLKAELKEVISQLNALTRERVALSYNSTKADIMNAVIAKRNFETQARYLVLYRENVIKQLMALNAI